MLQRRTYLKLLFSAGILGLLLRGLMCWQLSGVPSVASPSVVTDMATYLRLAKEIGRGVWPDHFDYQPFYYSVFLPFCRMLSGDSLWSVWVMQVLLGSCACVLAGLSAGRLYGKKAGISAAFLLAVSQVHVFYTPFALLEVLQSFWLALLLYLVLCAWESNRIWLWCLSALVLAASTLTRGNAVLFLPGVLGMMVWRNWSRKGLALVVALGMLVLFEVPQLPFAVRNWHYTGRWCGPSTAGEKVLALGNTPEAPAGGLEYPLTYHRWVADSEKKPGEGRISVSSRILDWACREPLVFGELKARALLLFWDRREIPNNVSLEVEGKQSFLTGILLPFAVLGPLALLGFWCLCRRWRNHSACRYFLLYLVLSSWFGTALFYNLSRFRLASLPLMAIGAGIAIAHGIRLKARLKREEDKDHARSAMLKAVLAVLAAVFVCDVAYGYYQNFCEASVHRSIRPNGVAAVFPDTALFYDHGPVSFGGLRFLGLPQEGLRIEKQFVVPENTAGKAVVRIAYIPQTGYRPRLYYHGRTYTAGEPVKDRFLNWAEVKLDLIPGDYAFSWIFPPAPEAGFAIDTTRDYGRSLYESLAGQKLSFFAEAFAELQVYY